MVFRCFYPSLSLSLLSSLFSSSPLFFSPSSLSLFIRPSNTVPCIYGWACGKLVNGCLYLLSAVTGELFSFSFFFSCFLFFSSFLLLLFLDEQLGDGLSVSWAVHVCVNSSFIWTHLRCFLFFFCYSFFIVFFLLFLYLCILFFFFFFLLVFLIFYLCSHCMYVQRSHFVDGAGRL